MKCTPEQRYAQAEQRARQHAEREPQTDDWALFTEPVRQSEGEERQGFFLWFSDEAELLDYLPEHCLFWCCPDDEPDKAIHRVEAAAIKLVTEYRKNRCSLDDLVFRLNNLLVPSGMEIIWTGPFSELLFGTTEIPRRTRLFCRRTLADMEEPGINPLDDSTLPAAHLRTFIECLGDFGLDGLGLNNLLPITPQKKP